MKKIFLVFSFVLLLSLTACQPAEVIESTTERTTRAQTTRKETATESTTEDILNEYDKIIDDMAQGIYEDNVASYIKQCLITSDILTKINVYVPDLEVAFPLAADYVARIAKQSEKYKHSIIIVTYDDGQGNITEWESDDFEVGTLRSSTGDLKFDVSLKDLLSTEKATESNAEDSGSASLGESNAVSKARRYLKSSAFSAEGLKDQLEFEGFTPEEAQYGVDHCGADWTEQAVLKAKQYIKSSAFSESGLISQLEFEGFTSEEASHGVELCGADWMEQAEKKAASYMKVSDYSRSGLVDQLVFEGFTQEQAEHGADSVGF